jgi:predicted transcriptional regulator
MKRPTPLAVRLSQAEKIALTEIAKQLKTSRNNFVRTACASMVRELRSEKLVGAIQ